MVSRFVQQQYVCFVVNEFAETDFCLLAPAEDFYHAFNMFGGQAAFCQSGTDFILGVGGEFLPDFVDAGHVIGVFLFLLKIAGIEIISQSGFAADGRDFPDDRFEQSGFPNPIGAY